MKKTSKRILLTLMVVACLLAGGHPPVYAQGTSEKAPVLIRDAEIENALRVYSEPIFKAAGLPPGNVNFYILQDDSLNAFVSGGMNIFVHTGLITESEDPLMLIGVIAHETGHISGGHLIRKNENMENTTIGAAIGYVLGAASIAAGAPQAGMAIISGGQQIAMRGALKYSRVQEQSADQAGLGFLDSAGFSAKGLYALLQKLSSNEIQFYGEVSPYALTHPLSQDRLSHIQNHMRDSPADENSAPENLQKIQSRIVAKIKGFLNDPAKTLQDYPAEDVSDKARYARAIAYHKKGNLELALGEIDALLQKYENDPYYNELKAQVLYENGKVKESIAFYRAALEKVPDSPLLMLELASAQLGSEDKKLLPGAISNFEKFLVKEPGNSFAWHQLAIAYGRNDQLGLSYLALAEEAALTGNKDGAIKFAKLSEQNLKEGDPALLRLNDIRKFLEKKDKEKSIF